jgi:hypothetical protein
MPLCVAHQGARIHGDEPTRTRLPGNKLHIGAIRSLRSVTHAASPRAPSRSLTGRSSRRLRTNYTEPADRVGENAVNAPSHSQSNVARWQASAVPIMERLWNREPRSSLEIRQKRCQSPHFQRTPKITSSSRMRSMNSASTLPISRKTSKQTASRACGGVGARMLIRRAPGDIMISNRRSSAIGHDDEIGKHPAQETAHDSLR